MSQIEEQMIMFPFQYISPARISIEESFHGVAIITGTLLAEGISRNGNLYTVEEMANIVPQAEGQPIYVGTMEAIDPNTGLKVKGMHANLEENRIGRIIRAVLDPIARKIKFWAEIVNTATHPNIIQKIKEGWGISIGGIATNAKYALDKIANKIVTKIMGLQLNHVQLLAPNVIRGMDSAQVEGVQIQESMIFGEEFKEPSVRIVKLRIKTGCKVVANVVEY